MKKLSEFKDDAALDVIANLIEPVIEICQDKDVATQFKAGKQGAAIATAIRAHKSAILAIMAALEEVPVEDYHCNMLTLPMDLMSLLNDEDMISFFKSQGLVTQGSSGSATVTTEESKK